MNFIAKVEDSQLAKIREIAEALGKIGVEVRQVQPILGLIAGSSGELTLDQLKIEGIASVEPDRKWGVGMPEAQGRKGAGKPLKDARAEEERRVEAKRSGGKGNRKA